MRKTLQAFVFLFIVINFIGCGTTHHFMPPRPLGDGEHFLSVNWHLDIGTENLSLIPDVNYYYGIDNTNTIGTGMCLPGLITHFSYANYQSNNIDNFNIYFTHINLINNFSYNPSFEFGYTYSEKSNGTWKSYSAGIALGLGDALDESKPAYTKYYSPKSFFKPILPFARVQVGGSDIAFSYNYYYGRLKHKLNHAVKYRESISDTIIVLPVAKIKEISKPEVKDFHHYQLGSFKIILTNNDTLVFSSPYFGTETLQRYHASFYWFLSQKGFISFDIDTGNADIDLPYRFTTLKYETLIDDWKNGKDIIIKPVSDEAKETIRKANNLFLDHSIGISIQDYNL